MKDSVYLDEIDYVDYIDDDEISDEHGICTTCNGSGEGMYDGSTCPCCKGKGEI